MSPQLGHIVIAAGRSVVDVTDTAGASLAWSEYAPFGAARLSATSSSAPANPFAYTGEYLDPTGLYHLRARQYDPTLGRFLSTDPVAPTLEDPYVGTYVYVRNMPLNAVDPAGEFLNLGAGVMGAIVSTAAYDIGTVGTNIVQGRDWNQGINVKDAVIWAGSGFLTGATGGLNLVGRVAVGYGAGSGSSFVSQQGTGRAFDAGEIFLGGGFGALGGAFDFGAGLIGAFRGVVAGGGLNAVQNYFNEQGNQPPISRWSASSGSVLK